MRLFAIVALWAVAGWDVGAWAEAYAGVPGFLGIVAGIVVGAALAIELRRRSAVGARGMPQTTDLASNEPAPALDRAA